MLPTFYLRASRDGGLPEGIILHLPGYASEVHRIGDVVSDFNLEPSEVLRVDETPHSPYDMVIASLSTKDEWSSVCGSIEMKDECWTCLWLPPFDIVTHGESIRASLGVNAVGAVNVSLGFGPRCTVLSSNLEERIILGDGPRNIWNAIFSLSGKYPARLDTLEYS